MYESKPEENEENECSVYLFAIRFEKITQAVITSELTQKSTSLAKGS